MLKENLGNDAYLISSEEASVGNLSCARLIANPRLLKSRTTTSKVKKRLPKLSREPGGRTGCRSKQKLTTDERLWPWQYDVWLWQGNYKQPMRIKGIHSKKMRNDDLKKKRRFVQKDKTHVSKKEPQERALVNSPARW